MALDPNKQYYADTEHTVNVEEATALMIGWMNAPVKRNYITVTKDGIPEEEHAELFELDGSVSRMVMELRDTKLVMLSKSIDDNEPVFKQDEIIKNMHRLEEMLPKVAIYGTAIRTEIANKNNGKPSLLEIVKDSSKKYRITKLSLRQWAMTVYGLEILPDYPFPEAAQKVEDEEVIDKSTLNIYLAIHLLVIVISKTSNKLRKNNKPTNSAIAASIIEQFNGFEGLQKSNNYEKIFRKGKEIYESNKSVPGKLSPTLKERKLLLIGFLLDVFKVKLIESHTGELKDYPNLESEKDVATYIISCVAQEKPAPISPAELTDIFIAAKKQLQEHSTKN